MKVERDQLIRRLESVQAGLASQKEILEQSKSFVFKNGFVYTFNDELFCRCPSGFDESICGAVPAEKTLKVLNKMKSDELDVTATDSELVFSRKGTARLRMENEITLPIDSVEIPEEWQKLPDDFVEAIEVVQQCTAGTDHNRQELTCVHIHPDKIEATDRTQICNWPMKTGVKEATLIRQSSIKNVIGLGIVEFAESRAWVHFRNSDGAVLSCRRFVEKYPDIEKALRVEGEKVTLPKGLADETDCASEFSSENEKDRVLVELSKGKVRIKGVGISGSYDSGARKSPYSGPSMNFLISPELLLRLFKKHNDCILSPNRLKVDGGKYTWVVYLATANQEQTKEDLATDDEETKQEVTLEELKRPEIVALSKRKKNIKREEEEE